MFLSWLCQPQHHQASIERSLDMRSPVTISQDLDRPNIFLSASQAKGISVIVSGAVLKLTVNVSWCSLLFQKDFGGVIDLLKLPVESIPKILIFAQTKDIAWKIYHTLSATAIDKHYVGFYHASLTNETKQFYQQQYSSPSNLRCLVATVAFGMVCFLTVKSIIVPYSLEIKSQVLCSSTRVH